jgi:aminoglycoside phosphotransferase
MGTSAIDDPAVPAVVHLTGQGAVDVLAAAVGVAGGRLREARVTQVQYRPGHDVVVRYRADVTWADGRRRTNETLLAGASATGTFPGAIPVVADVDGTSLTTSVWRWPFDPIVVGLEDATTPGAADDLLGPQGPGGQVEVVAYRPTERAVIRVTDSDGRCRYVKALPPPELPALVDRHARLRAAGLPVPEVLATDPDRGLVVLAELAGTTLRERIKGDLPCWPSVGATHDLLARIHDLDGFGPSARAPRTIDARGHVRVLGTVLPDLRADLDLLDERFAAAEGAVRARTGPVVHGDLHEGQLVVDETGAITGLLDVDDLGTGDPLDDVATLLGHLMFRASLLDHSGSAGLRRRLLGHVDELRAAACSTVAPDVLDLTVAAVLVGLATGPFRIQRPGWRDEVAATVAGAGDLAGST